MEWIINHWQAALVALGAAAALVWKFYEPLISLWGLYKARQLELYETQQRIAAGYQQESSLVVVERDRARDECAALKAALADLKQDLLDSVRQLDLRMELNRQDVAKKRILRRTTRDLRIQSHALRVLLQKHSINDSEIPEVERTEEEINESEQVHPLH